MTSRPDDTTLKAVVMATLEKNLQNMKIHLAFVLVLLLSEASDTSL